MKYMTSKESQKKYIIGTSLFSAITELYDDEELCKTIDYEVVKDAYPFSFMSNEENLFCNNNYHTKYKENMFDYLFNNKPLKDVLKSIDDITRIYNFTLKTDETSAGLILFIISLIILICMISSLAFLFIKKIEKRFNFLSNGFWIITILGCLILMCSITTL